MNACVRVGLCFQKLFILRWVVLSNFDMDYSRKIICIGIDDGILLSNLEDHVLMG
jgi:hypothetical protein